MNEADSSSNEKSSHSVPARIGWAALIVVTLAVCYFSNLGAIGFVGPDEPRYAWIARDMAESGDWVTPRLYGKPWFEKPVLYYWMAAASFKFFGVSEAAARFPARFAHCSQRCRSRGSHGWSMAQRRRDGSCLCCRQASA